MVSAMCFNGIDIAHAQLISAGYRYEFADNRYTKVIIFIGRSDVRSDYRCITSHYCHAKTRLMHTYIPANNYIHNN